MAGFSAIFHPAATPATKTAALAASTSSAEIVLGTNTIFAINATGDITIKFGVTLAICFALSGFSCGGTALTCTKLATRMDEEQVRKTLTGLWEKYLPEMDERVSVLERAYELLAADKLSEEARRSALASAHKLAGALGTFGRGHGTELAREIESMLECNRLTRWQIGEMKSKLLQLRSMLGQV